MNAARKLIPAVLAMAAVAMVVSSQPAHGGAPVDVNNTIYQYRTYSKAKVKGVGKATGRAGGAIVFQDGRWFAMERDDDGNDYEFAGSYSRLSSKKFALHHSAASRRELEGAYEDWFLSETGESVNVQITSLSVTVKVKKGGLSAKAKIKVRALVSGSFGTRAAKIKTKVTARFDSNI
jgi:hypothetical protein